MNERSGRRCAVVYNPIKVSDELREAMLGRRRSGWETPIWLATSRTIRARPITPTWFGERQIVSSPSGGDGTVRVVADDWRNRGSRWRGAGGHRKPAGPQPRDPTV